MDIPYSLPLDSDGFLRRECPSCLEQFKWHNGPANEEAEHYPDPSAYTCPHCGRPSGTDTWHTQEQVKYIEGVIRPAALRAAIDEIGQAFRGVRSKNLRFEMNGSPDLPDEPLPLTEADDMAIVASPCHGYEPIKIPEPVGGLYYCLICGSPFSL